MTLNTVELRLDAAALVAYGRKRGLTPSDVERDPGYALHCWLVEAFGDLTPRPYRVLEPSEKGVRVIGYSPADASALRARFAATREPVVRDALLSDGISSKPMPTDFELGARLSFETITSPVRRHGDKDKDAFLHALDKGEAVTREQAYMKWLVEKLEGVAELTEARIAKFRLVEKLRKAQRASPDTGRAKHRVRRPEVVFAGTLQVLDSAKFAALIRDGLGRERGLGFGMVLLGQS